MMNLNEYIESSKRGANDASERRQASAAPEADMPDSGSRRQRERATAGCPPVS